MKRQRQSSVSRRTASQVAKSRLRTPRGERDARHRYSAAQLSSSAHRDATRCSCKTTLLSACRFNFGSSRTSVYLTPVLQVHPKRSGKPAVARQRIRSAITVSPRRQLHNGSHLTGRLPKPAWRLTRKSTASHKASQAAPPVPPLTVPMGNFCGATSDPSIRR
jgi:hypothetical protein